MKEFTIEFLRFGGNSHILSKGDRYIIAMGNHYRPIQSDMTLDEREFRMKLEALRYPDEKITPDPGDKTPLEKAVRKFFPFKTLKDYHANHPDEPLIQLDLVTSASELWALPFEMMYRNKLLHIEDTNVVITRRIRRNTLRANEIQWPKIPRILFVAAHPPWFSAPDIPFKEHKEALQKVLDAWLYPAEIENYAYAIQDYSNHLTILENASLSTVRDAIMEAEKSGKPYSHIHVLAHGKEAGDRYNFQYGIALEGEADSAVMPEELAACLSEGTTPLMVTLSVCDSGNPANPIRPGNMAQALHVAGIPIVIASQFPLSMDGSNIFVREFYTSQLAGNDIRKTLHRVRKSLSENASDNHDFVSLVAYVELPEGYGDYLNNFHVRSQLIQLKVLKKWADYVLQEESRLNEPNVTLLRNRFGVHLEFFEGIFQRLTADGSAGSSILDEITGLMGSAYKTWAEVEFHYGKGKNEQCDALLAKSRDSYFWAFEHNLNAHWNGVQYLSLSLVTTGTLVKTIYWEILEMASAIDAENESDYWAQGSLVELYLLKEIACGEDASDLSVKATNELMRRLSTQTEDRRQFALDSTLRQLKKYTDWWTIKNGYFPGHKEDISEQVKVLISILQGDNAG